MSDLSESQYVRRFYHAFEQGMNAGHQGADHKRDCPLTNINYKVWWVHGCIAGNRYRELDQLRAQLTAERAARERLVAEWRAAPWKGQYTEGLFDAADQLAALDAEVA